MYDDPSPALEIPRPIEPATVHRALCKHLLFNLSDLFLVFRGQTVSAGLQNNEFPYTPDVSGDAIVRMCSQPQKLTPGPLTGRRKLMVNCSNSLAAFSMNVFKVHFL